VNTTGRSLYYRAKRVLFSSVAILLVIGTIAAAEFIAGWAGNVGVVRTETRRFLGESAPLVTTTRRLEPNLADEFINEQPGSGAKRLLRTDQFGLVIGPPNVKYESSANSILFLGGSTTENNEVDEQYRFPFLAAFQLSKTMERSFEGLNAGVRGHTSHDSLNLYLNHPSPRILDARVVVVMHNINDRLRLTLNDSYRSPYRSWPEASTSGLVGAAGGLGRSLWEWGRLNSNLLFLIDTVGSRFKTAADTRGIAVTEKTLEQHAGVALGRIHLFEQGLRNLVAVVKANGQLPVLMTQPLGRSSADQDAFNEAVRRVVRSEAVGLIDLANAIEAVTDRKALFYDDHIHFNNHGSKWASDEIASGLHSLLGGRGAGVARGTAACPDLQFREKSLLRAPLHEDVLRGRYPSLDQSERRLLFQRNHPRGSSIALLDFATGVTDEMVTSGDPLGLEHPTWIDEDNILFTKRTGDNRRLMVFDLRARKARALLEDAELQGAIANVGHEGAIYFAGYRHSDQRPPVLYVRSKEGGVPKPITLANSESWRPFASSTGEVYFINNESGRYQIYVKAAGDALASMRRVVPTEHEQWDPAVSNDGRTLAFAQREGGNFDVYVLRMGPQAGQPVRVTSSAEDEWDPRISPSGQYLVYAATSPHGDQIRAVCIR
jgi:hypothetical protein